MKSSNRHWWCSLRPFRPIASSSKLAAILLGDLSIEMCPAIYYDNICCQIILLYFMQELLVVYAKYIFFPFLHAYELCSLQWISHFIKGILCCHFLLLSLLVGLYFTINGCLLVTECSTCRLEECSVTAESKFRQLAAQILPPFVFSGLWKFSLLVLVIHDCSAAWKKHPLKSCR